MEKKYPEIEEFYQSKYNEDERMSRNPIEFLRCKEIISRYLNHDKMEIADIGGATGVFSYWLAQMNHAVHLLDYTPSHIEQAKVNGKKYKLKLSTFTCGDARHLSYSDEKFDLVLEMGPLYHLQEEQDRIRCLSEALRVLKDGGITICEVISRYVNLIDGFQDFMIDDERFVKIMDEEIISGKHSPGDTPYFTTAFFHTPDEIVKEMKKAGFIDVSLVAVESFANILDTALFLKDEHRKELLLKYIRATESNPDLIGISAHYIAIGKKRTEYVFPMCI